mgnify:CR=1 FL=1
MRCCQLTVVKSGFLTGLSHHNTRQRSIHTAYSQQDRRVLTHRLMRTQVSTHMGAFRPPAYCHATAAKSVVSVMFTVTAMYCAGHTQDTSHWAQANCEIVLTHFISDSSWKQLSSFHPVIHTSTTIPNHLPSHAPAHPSQALFAARHSPPSVHKTNTLHKLTSPHRKYNTAAECSVP